MEAILKSEYTLWAFFLLSSIMGYVNTQIDKGFIKKVTPMTLVVIDAVVGAIALTFVILFKTGGSMQSTFDEMRGLGIGNYAKLFLLAAIGTTLGIFGTSLLKHHNVSDFENIEFFAGILVTGLAMVVLAEKKMTTSRLIGFITLSIGAYLIS